MSTVTHSARVVRGALLTGALLSFVAGGALMAQQAAVQAPAVTTATPAVVAPAASPLFVPAATETPTIAAAVAANEASMQGENHTFVVSTLALVLGIIVLVLLID